MNGISGRMRGALAAVALSLAATAYAQAPRSPTPATGDGPLVVTEVARGFEHPWGLAFLPDGRMLVTERPGRLRARRTPTASPGARSPACPRCARGGQGGLLGIALSPDFAQDRLVYLSFAEAGDGGAGTAVARGRLTERRARERGGHLAAGAQGRRRQPLGLAARVRARRHAVRDDGRPLQRARARAGPRDDARQGDPHQRRRQHPARQPVRRPRRRASGDLVLRPSQPAGRRAAPGDRAAVDDRARRARRRRAQSPRRRVATTAGPSSRTASTTRASRSARARRRREWSSPSTTGIP